MFRVSLIASAPVSASVDVEAPDVESAIAEARRIQASGGAPWAFTGPPSSTGGLPPRAWASPVPTPETSVAVAPSPNTVLSGLPISAVATVSSAYGVPAGGTVEFFSDGSSVGTAPVTGGSATASGIVLPPGAHSVTAVYSGSAPFLASPPSAPAAVLVTLPAQAVAVATVITDGVSPISSAVYGGGTAVTGTVTAGAGTPTGAVQISAAAGLSPPVVLGTAPLVAGTYSLDVTGVLPPVYGGGNIPAPVAYAVSVHYPGDVGFLPGDAPAAPLTVTKASLTMVQSALLPAAGPAGLVLVSCACTPVPNPATPASGTVTFTDSLRGALATAPVVAGVANSSFTSDANGAYSVTASYSGDPNFLDGQVSNAVAGAYTL